MLRNTAISTFSFFYALGNTPAVNLTQDLPPEEDAATVLLAGCGDGRSILHTVHNETGKRSLDVTCCDIEPSIIARNVLLFSFLLEDDTGIDRAAIWDVQFHMMVRRSSLDLMEAQIARLLKHSQSLQAWKASRYGQVISFCDDQTLSRVRDTWKLYTTHGLSKKEKLARKREVQVEWVRAKEMKNKFFGDGISYGAIRSAAPASFMAIKELPPIFQLFWKNGTLSTTTADLLPNPTFFLSHNTLLVHYGTDPLLGFHLATAFVPLASGPASSNQQPILVQTDDVIKAAQIEFSAWLDAFISFPKDKLRIRCFAGDALAFGHTLQCIHFEPDRCTGHLYRDSWSFVLLELDRDQYGSDGDSPTSFNVIDVSNLADHLGPLNIITSFAPLMDDSPATTLYTEVLIASKAGADERMRDLLCGDLESTSLLLGLVNVEAWTNATCVSDAEEAALNKILSQSGDSVQLRSRICWKRLDHIAASQSCLSFDPSDLAAIFMKIYHNMFRHEDVSTLLGDLNKHGADRMANPYYNRASFVAVLKHVLHRVDTDRATFFVELFDLIENDGTSMIGMNLYQELCLHLHMQDVFSVPTLSADPSAIMNIQSPRRLRNIKNLPRVLSITVQVPAVLIKYVGDFPLGQLGIPSLCCTIQNTSTKRRPWSNLFSVVQAGFGTVQKFESAAADLPNSLSVQECKADWSGKTSLIVSFFVPTWTLLQAHSGTELSVGFQGTIGTARRHASKLGLQLSLYATELENESNVFISQMPPHMVGYPSICPSQPTFTAEKVSEDKIQVLLDSGNASIERLSIRVNVSGGHKAELADKSARVTTSQISPTVVTLNIGAQEPLEVTFPRPVSANRSKLRVARKSSYVEILAPLMSPLDQDFPQEYVLPVFLQQLPRLSAVCWHTPYVNLDNMPQIDLSTKASFQWLNLHTSLMFSAHERELREQGQGNNSSVALKNYSRVDFKDSLMTMFGHVAGVGQDGIQKARVFGLNHKTAGGIHVVVFVSKLLLDLSNRTVVLDAAVIPLTQKMVAEPLFQDVMTKVEMNGKLCLINVTKDELTIWKSVLPAFAERCRTWKHKSSTCEYIASGQIPPPLGLNDASTPLCSCAEGSVPENFMPYIGVPQLNLLLRKYATRIAISPVSSVSYIEPSLSSTDTSSTFPGIGNNDIPIQIEKVVTVWCAVCGKEKGLTKDGESKPLQQCGRCRKVSYCSQECQKQHWKAGHKIECAKSE